MYFSPSPSEQPGCLGDPGFWGLQHSSAHGGSWLFFGMEGHVCMGELGPSWCPSLAVGMETLQLEGLCAPPAAAWPDWLIVGPAGSFGYVLPKCNEVIPTVTEVGRHQGSPCLMGNVMIRVRYCSWTWLSVAHTVHLSLTVWEMQVEVAATPVSLSI